MHGNTKHNNTLDRILDDLRGGQYITAAKWKRLEQHYPGDLYVDLLYKLTRLRYREQDARSLFFTLMDHREDLSQKLGRPVGIATALADWCEREAQPFSHPVVVGENLLQRQEKLALRDELTGLYNRRFFNTMLERQMNLAGRLKDTFSLVMTDVDRFKLFNDNFGHRAGDMILEQMSRLLETGTRNIDYLARYGGEEFAIILPGADKSQAVAVANRCRQLVASQRFCGAEGRGPLCVTISAGVANWPQDAGDLEGLVSRADAALYQAKRNGRNRVCTAGPDRRRHPRFRYQTNVRFLEAENNRQAQTGRTVDLSVSGLKIHTPHRTEPGQPLDIFLQSGAAGDGHIMRLAGHAVRSVPAPNRPDSFYLGVTLVDRDEKGLYRRWLQRVAHAEQLAA